MESEMNQKEKSSLRILAVSSYFPFPLDRGDPVRVDMYLRALNEVAGLTILVTEREDTTSADKAALERRLPGATIKTYRPASTSLTRRFTASRWVLSILRLTPSWVANRSSRGIHDYLTAHASSFDFCFLIGEAAGQYAAAGSGSRLHWDKSNVLAASTKGDLVESRPWSAARMRLWVISRVSRQFERSALSRADQVSVTSAAEAQRLGKFHGRVADYIHASAVEPIQASSKTYPDSKVILWMGSFQYHSNTNGLMRFIEDGLPILRAHGYTLRLVGSGATSEFATKLESIPGVDFWGFVPDLSDAVKDVKAAVVPLWTGAGVKIKTLTLLGLGVPIVGTEAAFEGISNGASLALTESAEQMAQICVEANASQLERSQNLGFKELAGTFSENEFFHRVASQTRIS